SLSCIEETVKSQLPEETGDTLAAYFQAAGTALVDDEAPEKGLEVGSPAEALFNLALIGDMGGARHFLLEEIKSERMTLESAILEALLPAAREAGRRWHLGEMGVAAEHVITATLRSALHSVTAVLPRPKPNGKAAFIAAVPGDAHDTALLAFALLLEQDGWRVALAGADTPTEEIDATAEGYDCDLIALSATLPSQRYALVSYLGSRDGTIPILVGGSAVTGLDDALAIGAEGYAENLPAGLVAARELVDL
ncbi:MAG: cobalamin B12-binding domain-containing protein, partial [Planctomycetota bacterium]